jgi:hypothetical protein
MKQLIYVFCFSFINLNFSLYFHCSIPQAVLTFLFYSFNYDADKEIQWNSSVKNDVYGA